MGWRDDKANTVAQLANMADGTTPNTTYWEAQAYQQIKNILTGMDNSPPVDQDFTDLATALADSDVQTYKMLLVTQAETTAATLTIPVASFALVGIGFISQITSAASSSYANITINAKDNFFIHNLRIQGGSSATGNGITITDSDNGIISNVWIDNIGANGIQETGTSNNNIITGCSIYNTITNTPPVVLLGAASYVGSTLIELG